MRMGVFVFALAALVTCYGCGRMSAGTKATATSGIPDPNPASNSSTASPADSVEESTKVEKVPTKVDFASQIRPILEARCQPCHFSGGKVYAKMPFDRPDTIRTLGTKLFTRIKDENERRLIRDFLAQE